MNTTIKVLGFLLILCFIMPTSEAQLTDRLKRQTERKVQNRANRKVDNTIDKGLNKLEDAIFGGKKNKNQNNNNSNQNNDSNAQQNAGFADIFEGGFSKNTKVREVYTFSSNMHIKMESTSKKGKKSDVMEAIYYFPKDDEYFAAEILGISEKQTKKGEGMKIIYDMPNNTMLTLMEDDGKKQAIPMSLNMDKIQEKIAEDDSEDAAEDCFKPTGKTQTILGYSCKEYFCDDGKTATSIWLSEEVALNIIERMNFFNAAQKGKNKTGRMPAHMPAGMFLKMNIEDKKTGDLQVMEVIELNLDNQSQINMSQYQVMDMASMLNDSN
ncbi:MAG: DUF4412 domain-containing protein [Bernardetiaceae bacterium]|nr:DUF4412 domain-containing protein [Bernardetiaceae bacterium]